MSDPRAFPVAILEGTAPLPERMTAALAWLDENLRSDPSACHALIEALVPLARSAGDAVGEAWMQFHLGWLAIDADDFAPAMESLEAAKTTFEELAHQEGTCRCHNALGVAYQCQGVFDLALDFLRESLAEAEQLGSLDLADTASGNLADCLFELGDFAEALKVIEHKRTAYVVAPHNISVTHQTAGQVYHALGRLEEAERELQDAIRTAGSRRLDRLKAEQSLAEVHVDAGRLLEGEVLVKAGLAECNETSDRGVGVRFRLTQARIALAKGRVPEAIAELKTAIRTAQEIGARKLEADGEKYLHLAWQAQGDCVNALGAFIRYTELKEAMKGEQASRRVFGLHAERARREAQHFESLYKQVSTISEIGQHITAHLDLDATLETLYGAVNSLMNAPTMLIGVVDEEKGCLDYRLVMVQGKRQKAFSFPLDRESFGCWCVHHRSDILIADLENDYRQYVSSYDDLAFYNASEKSLVFVPLVVGDKVVGILSVQSHLRNAYDKRKVEIIRAVGAYVAIAIENAKLFRQVQHLATLDSLTGLLNRRRLNEIADAAYRQARRYERPTGVIMADVDHFKRVNDTRGHDAGDNVLRALAELFQGMVRVCDAVGRFGGEEFVILLLETDLQSSIILAERLREAVEAMVVTLPGGGSFCVTASFGVAVIRPDDPSHEAALKRADMALYRSKTGGRNRISAEAGE